MQMRERKTQTKTELPEDIIHDEILPRLPLKSLQRFRCVCKPWRSLFSDAKFIKLHLSRQYDLNYFLKRSFLSETIIISRSKETRIDTPTFIGHSGQLIGSINGLIYFVRPDSFTLWNPAIRQYKELSTTQLHTSLCKKNVEWSTSRGTRGHLYGFGWDPSRNEYKMVIVCYARPDLRHGFVYSCSSDSWTELVLPTGIFGIKTRYSKSPCPAIIVKECPYWSYSRYLKVPGKICKRRCTVVFKFVAENNEFRSLPDFDLAARQELKLINLKDSHSLGVMTYKNKYPFALDRVMNIYSLDHEGSAGVWSKVYTLQPTEFDQRGFPNQLSCYDTKTKEMKGVVDGGPFKFGHFAYTPSLVFVHGMKNSLHSETFKAK